MIQEHERQVCPRNYVNWKNTINILTRDKLQIKRYTAPTYHPPQQGIN